MASIASAFDHGDRHTGVFDPVERRHGQLGPDAIVLESGIDSEHVNLADAPLPVQLNGNETGNAFPDVRYPDLDRLRRQNFLNRSLLIRLPVGMESIEDCVAEDGFE
jgi:hypothetical protein